MIYPENLVKLPPFEIWFAIAIVIAKKLATSEEVVEDVISINSLPLDMATCYWSMYAFGNNLRVESVEHHLAIANLGVVATFEHECCSHSNDQNPIMALIENVGWIEEILELDYWRFQTIVLLCNWMVANYKGSTTIVRRDEYGFTLMNFECLIPFLAHSFVFPMHFEQAFFSKVARSRGNWKVVLH